MIVLDASALIAQLDETDAHHGRARELLLRCADQRLGASVITLAETLVAPARAGRLDQAQTALLELGVQPIELGADAAAGLARVRAETALRMPDCCVIYAAMKTAADAVATFDEQLGRAVRTQGLQTTP